MRKIVLGVVTFVFVIAGVGCGSSSDSKTTLIPPVTVTRPDSSASTTQCVEWASQYSDLVSQYVTALGGVDTSDPSVIRTAVTAGRAAVSTGRTLIDACPQYASASSKLDDLERSLNSTGY